MKRTVWFGFLVGLIGSLALLVIVGATNAQGDQPLDKIITVQPLAPTGGGGPDAPLGTTFSYQGQLKINGLPYTGNCDMQFTLWNGTPGSGGISITTVSALPAPINVSAGLFTTFIDFGDQFKGDYRQIEPRVRCPSGVGVYQSLGAQVIYGVPYALGLRPGATISGTADPALTINDNSANGIALAVNNMSDAQYSTSLFADAFTGRAIVGYSLAMTGTGVGVFGASNSSTGVGVVAQGGGGTALSIWGGSIKVGGAGIDTDTPVFIHQVKTGPGGNVCDIQNYSTVIDNALINGRSDAILIVTPNYGSKATGIAPAVGIPAVYYDSANECGKGAGRWVVYNLNTTAQANNSLFNVMAVLP
jgi:hypothetical protein